MPRLRLSCDLLTAEEHPRPAPNVFANRAIFAENGAVRARVRVGRTSYGPVRVRVRRSRSTEDAHCSVGSLFFLFLFGFARLRPASSRVRATDRQGIAKWAW